jgi:hypothetical protein
VTRISDRRDCEGQKFGFEIDVPACGGTPPPTTSNFACGLPIWLIAAAAGLFLSTAVLALTPLGCFPTCPPSPALADFYIALGIGAGVALVVGAVLVGLAALLCELDVCPCLSECDWLRITWIGLLIAALVAGYLAGCCTPLWTIGVVAVAAAGAGVAFVAWYLRCDPSFCRVIADIAWATGSAVGTIFIYLPLLLAAYPCPEAATCGAAIVAVVTGAVSLVTGTIALTSCID